MPVSWLVASESAEMRVYGAYHHGKQMV
jgi:hypothetical protein